MSHVLVPIAVPVSSATNSAEMLAVTTDPVVQDVRASGEFDLPLRRDDLLATYGRPIPGTDDKHPVYQLVPVPVAGQPNASAFQWANQTGQVLSPVFRLSAPPVQVMAYDPDGDGDDDLWIGLADGSSVVSYNVAANFAALTPGASESAVTPDVQRWLGAEFYACLHNQVTPLEAMKLMSTAEWIRQRTADFFNAPQTAAYVSGRRVLSALMDVSLAQDITAFESPLEQINDPLMGPAKKIAGAIALFVQQPVSPQCQTVQGNLARMAQLALDNALQMVAMELSTIRMLGKMDGGIGMYFNVTSPASTLSVTGVVPGGPADAADVRPGDQIVAINNEPVGRSSDPDAALQKLKLLRGTADSNAYNAANPAWPLHVELLGAYGSDVTLTVERGGEQRTVTMQRTWNALPHVYRLLTERPLTDPHLQPRHMVNAAEEAWKSALGALDN